MCLKDLQWIKVVLASKLINRVLDILIELLILLQYFVIDEKKTPTFQSAFKLVCSKANLQSAKKESRKYGLKP